MMGTDSKFKLGTYKNKYIKYYSFNLTKSKYQNLNKLTFSKYLVARLFWFCHN